MVAPPDLPPDPPAPVLNMVVSSVVEVGLPTSEETVTPTVSSLPPSYLAPPLSIESCPTPAIHKPSWASVISENEAAVPPIRVSVSTSKGVVRTSIPVELLKDQVPLWTKYIAGHFIGDVSPHIGKVHATVNRLWTTQEKKSRIDAQFISPKVVLFRIDDEKMRLRVLQRHFWHVSDIPMIVQEWTPSTAGTSPDLSSIPLWVDFIKVPDSLFTKKGLLFLGNLVGKAQKLHPSTERCMRFDVARVLVEVNLNKELPSIVCLKGETDISIPIAYPWLPPRCVKCGSWGHKVIDCVQPKEAESLGKVTGEDNSLAIRTNTEAALDKGPDALAETEIPEQVINTQGGRKKSGDIISPAGQINTSGDHQLLEVAQNGNPMPRDEAEQSGNVVSKAKGSPQLQEVAQNGNSLPRDEAEQSWTVVSKAKGSPGRTIMTRGKCVATGELIPSRYQALDETQNLDDLEDGEIHGVQQDTSASEEEGSEAHASYSSGQEVANTIKAVPKKQTTRRQVNIKVSRQTNKSKKSSSRKA